ncbi:hypothetical protein PAE4_20501 [Bacillus altitudinis]|uniref:Uncharacterized protein n=1 Tax=Bacillus altitudinis TaxID=293387 RepID=A0A653T8G7_BACAB|nr:hypothetical protein BAME_04920 [Bacillus sp. M 2-6]PYH24838.1 hypothetical protein US8_01030 [Bacillus altitudinis]SPR93080.1 hypothetical protein PAE4_20501 [Bacillus altitudinis]VXB77497.1 conserved hypothetical protein [Bacillus altitudinis]
MYEIKLKDGETDEKASISSYSSAVHIMLMNPVKQPFHHFD